uniref:Uncharacterized protein n=1 Tax=Leviviridae sp. TaxID=2027243 RepID=A0A514D4M8_9VIRU|nr:MAG: hypothetical protein H3BulkLitter171370_000001 [Leviviridae sp.]
MTLTPFDNRANVAGSATTSSGTTTTTGKRGSYGSLVSFGNPRPYRSGASFNSTINDESDWFLSGDTAPGFPFNTHYANYRYTGVSHPGVSAPSGLSVADLLSRSNPSQPIVDVPVALAELRELPDLFRIAGRTIAQKIASGNLNYQFGWKPLLGDLGNLLGVQASIDKRVAHLSRLHENGGGSYKADVGTNTLPGTKTLWAFPPGGGTMWVRHTGFCRRWISVSWIPSYDPRTEMPDLNQIRQQAFRSVLGLTVDLSTAWELLPWSWLVDWFSNLGNILAARRNLVGFVPGACYTMTHTERHSNFTLEGSSVLTHTYPYLHQVVKERVPTSSSSISANVPFLSGRQLGILASLAVARR